MGSDIHMYDRDEWNKLASMVAALFDIAEGREGK